MVASGQSRIGLTVLLAEDNEINAIVATETLTTLGCVVVQAWDGQEAVDKADTDDFDLILLDIHMPVNSGIEVCQIIRSGQKNSSTVIGALTA